MREHFEALVQHLVTQTLPITLRDVERASVIAERYPHISSRDAVHTAVMLRAGATHVVSADTGFDQISEIERLDPMLVGEWRERVTA